MTIEVLEDTVLPDERINFLKSAMANHVKLRIKRNPALLIIGNYSENSHAQAALATLLEKNNSKPLEDTILAMSSSPEKRMEMAATLAKSFYLKDSEDKAVDAFIGKPENFENPYVQLLLRITGRKDFKSQKLCISSESSPADVHRATLILHLCIVLASHFRGLKQKKLTFMSYFTSPLISSNAHTFWRLERVFSSRMKYIAIASSMKHHFPFAPVEHSLLQQVMMMVMKQSVPTAIHFEKLRNSKNTVAVKAIQPSKVPVCLTCPQDLSIRLGQMDPREFRVLHLFVYSALYGGY